MAKETNLTALNEIAEKCGGEPQSSNAKAIKEIADNFSGGGGGGGGALVVHIEKTVISEDEAHYQADKTAGEILAAMESGQGVAIPFTMVNESGEEYIISKVGEGGSYDSNFVTESGMYALIVPSLITGEAEDIPLIAATLDDYPSGSGSK